MKKLISLVLALAMIMMVGAVYAESNAEPGEFTNGEFSTTADGNITVSGIVAGDTVVYFQLVEADPTATSGWKLTTVGSSCGVTLEELLNGITAAEAAIIAGNVSGSGTALPGDSVSRTATVAPGLYYILATPAEGNTDTIYNPAFVSSDYYAGGNTVSLESVIGSSTVLKKSTITFDKEVTGADQYIDTKPGDTIPYKISTKIPSFGEQFEHPVFTVTDTLSAGLTLSGDVTVKYGDNTATASNADVTITKGTPANGFTVAFTKTYLTGLAGIQPNVEITYSAEVTTQALENVTYLDNRAHLVFSNTPTETTDKDDITRHYTFSIDANLNGGNHGNERTRELIKIGVDPVTGETITDFTSWVEGDDWTTYSPLAGAVFTLTGNGITRNATSTADGYITFNGLDAGSYTLTETSAPDGYVRDTTPHTVVITPSYTGDVLNSYTVTIDGATVSTYTIENMRDEAATVETTVDNSSETFPVINTRGVELPSTGGIGTTIFYIVGGLLLVGAAIVLVARRKAEN
jgi:fimbrial isopeptide formation D2 family protein/LPXTG-motif cell wall-anchored protein